MTTQKFKTNINCGGCVAKVTPAMSALEGVDHWEVDVKDSQKTLSVSGSATAEKVENAIKKMGFNIEKL